MIIAVMTLLSQPAEVEPPVEVEAPPPVTTQAVTESYEATAYIAMCSSGCIGITASGVDVRDTIYYGEYRILAADDEIPFYSLVKVVSENHESFVGIVLDRGGAIGEGRIDVLMGSEIDALNFGRQKVEVEVLRWGK